MVLEDAHIVTTLAVTDIEKAKAFYGRNLGLRQVETHVVQDDDAMFETNHGSRLYLYERPEPSGSTATALSFAVDDVDAAVKALQKKGVRFEDYDLPEMGIKTVNGVATMEGYKTGWFKDPSGNILAVGDKLKAQTGKGQGRPIAQRA